MAGSQAPSSPDQAPGDESLGSRLRRWRLAAGLSQEALAEQAGLSAKAIAQLETGKRTAPRPETLRLLADALALDSAARTELAVAARRAANPATPTTEAVPEPGTSARLPVASTPLIGRESDIAMVTALLAGDARLVTLMGPGGVGKTRLATTVAEGYRDRSRDVAWVELARLTDPALVATAIAQAMGAGGESGQARVDALVDAIGERELLLALDNCEHLRETVRELAATLLQRCPNLNILATSRWALRVQGEHIYPVSPLALPDPLAPKSAADLAGSDAVGLFVRRARAARPDFRLTDGNARDVATICRRLDGLPLALELAAARLRALTPAALEALLHERLRVLTGGPADAPARQRTMAGAIEWSYELLPPERQRLFRQLAAFSGGCTLEAVADICADGDPFAALDELEGLIDQSLLDPMPEGDGQPRYAMLEVMREYATSLLEASGEAEAMRTAHAAWCLELAERGSEHLRGPAQYQWLSRFAAEHDNLRAALGWALGQPDASELALRLAVALWEFWHMRGFQHEARHWLERALDGATAATPALRARALINLANTLANLGEPARADDHYRASLAIWEGLGDQRGIAAASVGIGIAARDRGDYPEARIALDRALAAYATFAEGIEPVPGLYNLGILAVAEGGYDKAALHFQEARARCARHGAAMWTAYIDLELGQVERRRGNIDEAHRLLTRCVAYFREHGEIRLEARTLSSLGDLWLHQEEVVRGLTAYDEAADRFLKLHDELGLVDCLEGFTGLAVLCARPELAVRLAAVADAWRTQQDMARASVDRTAFQNEIDAARSVLDPASFDQAWATGRATGVEEALAAARSGLPIPHRKGALIVRSARRY